MKRSRLLILAAVAVVVAGAILLLVHSHHKSKAAAQQGPTAPVVNFVVAQLGNAPTQLTLPAALLAYQDTPIYARTTGFIRKWFFDIGDHVRAGDVLASIETPDLDQELNQARAALAQTEANLKLAQISAQRWHALGEQHAVPQQDVDTKEADYEARQADTKAAEANVERFVKLQEYQKVTAPYDGVISARNAQIGTLINSGTGAEIYHVSQVDPLRVYANVPQTYIRSIQSGLEVQVTVPEFQNRPFSGHVVRFAGAVDPTSRTLLVDIEIPNPHNELFPGMFCEVHFSLVPDQPAIIVPSIATMIRSEGAIVATIDDANHIRLARVRIGRDFGTQMEILEGLKAGTRIVANPNDALTDGLLVQPRDEKIEEQQEKQEQEKQQKQSGEQNKKPAQGKQGGH